jgi:predicted nucleic acid-binding protein
MREAMASGLALKSHDAIHLGTAMNQRCDQVFTYDEKLWKFSTAVGIPLGPPSNPQPQLSEQRPEHG